MTADKFRFDVKREADLEDDAEAEETIETVLSVLGERISQEESRRIAGYLPDEFETWVIDWDTHSERAFGIDEFLDRVAADLDVSKTEAQKRAQTVVQHLEVELRSGEETKLRNQLPEEYDTLF